MDIYLMAALFLFLVITFQFITAPRLSLGAYWDVVNHNENFLNNDPDFIKENPPLSNVIGYVLGIVFIFIIGIGVIVKSTLPLQFVHYSSVIVFVLQILHNHFYLKKIKQKIPNASKRSTRLEQRNIFYFISKKTVLTFGIFLFMAFFGMLAAALTQKLSFQLFMAVFVSKIALIVFVLSCAIAGAQTSTFSYSKWIKNEKIVRASFSLAIFVAAGFLIDLYIRLAGVFFEMPSFIYASVHEYILGAAGLGAFMHFVLSMKLDIPDWYGKSSIKNKTASMPSLN